MITASELLGYRSAFMSDRHLEKDYLQATLLQYIYSNSYNLVFKGGTCLAKIYGLDRFSEVLDFDIGDENTSTANRDITKAINLFKLTYVCNIHEVRSRNISHTLELRNIKGPLFDISGIYQKLKIEVNLNERPVLEPVSHFYAPQYLDIKKFAIRSLDVEEIAAEKIRAIMQRRKARDIYDLYYIINRLKRTIDLDLIKRKVSGFTLSDFFNRLEAVSENMWRDELSNTVSEVPEFEAVRTIVKSAVS